MRNIGMHAGGVLIAPGKITDFCPLYMQPGSDSAVSQFDKDDVEAIGLVKFDFLGLATLTILEIAKEFIKARRPKLADFDYDKLPLDDQRLQAVFRRPHGPVFQFKARIRRSARCPETVRGSHVLVRCSAKPMEHRAFARTSTAGRVSTLRC